MVNYYPIRHNQIEGSIIIFSINNGIFAAKYETNMQGTKNLTEGPIKKQLFNLALPIMGTSFIQMAYSITDMAWVGRLGSEAVAAIGAVGILTWMTTSISYLNKVGAEVSVAQSIGAREEEGARAFASHNLTIALIISICCSCWLILSSVSSSSTRRFPPQQCPISGSWRRGFRSFSCRQPAQEFITRQD